MHHQTLAVSRRNRQTAPSTKIPSHAARLNTQFHSKPLADQRVMDEFVEPVQRGELCQRGVGVREVADRNEEAAGEAAHHQDERDDLR